MQAKITDLNEWKAAHPPAVRCANAMARCWWNWVLLPWWATGKLLEVKAKTSKKAG